MNKINHTHRNHKCDKLATDGVADGQDICLLQQHI